MEKDSDRIGVPFDSAPLVPGDQGGGDMLTSKFSNLQILESFYAERMEMLSRIRQRYLAQNKILNTQTNFENSLLAATSLSLVSVVLSGCYRDYIVEANDDIKIKENESGVLLTAFILKKYTQEFTIETVTIVDPSQYTVTLDDPSGKFEIRDGQVALKQDESLDYEALQAQGTDFLTVTLRITSNMGNFKPISEQIKITVLDDENESNQISDIRLNNASVDEDSPGVIIGNISGIDALGNFFIPTSIILDDPSGKFEVRGDTQIALKAGVSLDYETKNFYFISITLIDGDGVPFSKTFKIDVIDQSGPPTNITLPTTIIQEDVAGFSLGKLTVTDPDPNDTFTFILEGKDIGRTLFIRDKFEVVNGVLKLKDGKSLSYSDSSLNISEIKDDGGTLIIKVTATDLSGSSFTKDFTIILNDKPQSVDDSVTINEDESFIVLDLVNNDTDEYGQNLKVRGFEGFGTKTQTPNQLVDPNIGSLSLDPTTGNITYGPKQNYTGSFTFRYTVQDAYGGTATATVTVTVNPINDAPIVPARAITIGEDSPQIAGNVLADASDPEGDSLFVTTFKFNGVDYSVNRSLTVNPITVADIGTFNMNFGGEFEFTPAANFYGNVPITFTTRDTPGAQTTSTLTITVQSVNDNPVAPQVSVSTDEDTAISGDVLPGDFRDADGDVVNVARYTFDGVQLAAGFTAIRPKGTFVLNTDGTYTFTPRANFNGQVDVTFRVIDGQGGEDSSGQLTINVNPINDNPALPDTGATVAEDTIFRGNVIPTNYRDVDGDSVVVGNYRVAGANVGVTNVGNILTITQDVRDFFGNLTGTITVGTIVIQQSGSYTFTPAANFSGAVPAIIVTFADGKGGFDTSLLSITVTPVNDAPTNLAVPDNPSVNENELGALVGSFNFTDPDKGDTFTYEIMNQNTNQVDTRFIVQGNQIFLKGTESLNYETENADGDSTIPLTLKVTDSGGASVSQSFIVTVIDQNDPLTVANDSVIQDEGTGDVTGNVLDNDFDEDGVAFTSLGLGGNNGILIPGFYIDGVTAGSYTGFLSGLLSGIDFLFPGAGSIQVTNFYEEDSTVTIPNVGTFKMDDDGSYTFTPDAGFVGTVPTIHYGVLSLAPGTTTGIEALLDPSTAPSLNISINAIGNQAPTANPDTNSGDEDAGNITGNVIVDSDTDPDGDTLFVTKFKLPFGSDISVPQNGSTSFVIPDADNSKITFDSNGGYTFEPAPNFFTQKGEPILVNYTISDGNGGTSSSTLEIRVNSVNDLPVANKDIFFNVTAYTLFTGNVITGQGTPDADADGVPDGADTDPDGDRLQVTSFKVRDTVLQPEQVFDDSQIRLSIDNFGGIRIEKLTEMLNTSAITYTISDGNGGEATGSVIV